MRGWCEGMGMIFIDTNVLYELIGLSNNSKVNHDELQKFINDRNDVYLPYAVIAEILVKNRDSNETLVKIIEYIIKSKFNFSIDWLSDLMGKGNIPNYLAKIKVQVNELFKEKIEVESDMLIFFLSIVKLYVGFMFCCVFNVPLDEGMSLVRDIILFDNEEVNGKLRLKNAYDENPQKYVANIFNQYVNEFVDKWVDALNEKYPADKGIKKFTKKVNEYKDVRQQPLLILSLLEGKEWFDNEDGCLTKDNITKEVRNFIWNVLGNKTTNKYVADYSLRLLDTWRISGNKFKKNDILDMIILLNLSQPNSKIIVFDENSYDFLKELNHPSIMLIDRFYQR